MFALARVIVLIASGAVKARESVRVLGEVRGNPVDDYRDACLMTGVHEMLEIVRRSEARGRCIVADHLVTPRPGEGMLSDRHQFDVRVAHLLHVSNQFHRHLAIGKRFTFGSAHPGFQMDFVGRDRCLQPLRLGTLVQPLSVPPFVLAERVNDRCGARRNFRVEAIGIRLHLLMMMGSHGILISRAFAEARHEDLPKSPGTPAHRMAPQVPPVEIPDQAYDVGIGRPDREARALHTVHGDDVCAHAPIALVIRAFAVEVKIELGEHHAEIDRVFDLLLIPLGIRNAQKIVTGVLRQCGAE